jgi:cytochrome c2
LPYFDRLNLNSWTRMLRKMKIRLIFFILLAFFSCQQNDDKKFVCGTRDSEIRSSDTTDCEGKTLFRKNCAACHNASKVKSTGPGLQDVFSRIPSREWAYRFVKNSDEVIKSGDVYANKIYEEYNKAQQTRFPFLKNQEIDAILDYCDKGTCQ